MKELDKNGCNEQEMKIRKALSDVKDILDRHCEQGKLQQETHDRILDEMKNIFHDEMEGETKPLKESNREQSMKKKQ